MARARGVYHQGARSLRRFFRASHLSCGRPHRRLPASAFGGLRGAALHRMQRGVSCVSCVRISNLIEYLVNAVQYSCKFQNMYEVR